MIGTVILGFLRFSVEMIGTVILGFLRFSVEIRLLPRTATVFPARTTEPTRIFRQRRQVEE
jgi:hypothetical protein